MPKTVRVVAYAAGNPIKTVNIITAENSIPNAHPTLTQAAGVATGNAYPEIQPAPAVDPNLPTVLIPGYVAPA